MLRITIHDNLESVIFQLEGKLAGLWVREVEECRQRLLAGQRWPAICFDLSGVTFIDAEGKAFLAAMHRQGAQFVAADCMTKAIVAEIAKATMPPAGTHSAKAKARRN